ncbi:hypothetical protein K227x_33350 [Rubripirellula lacrimiformis]|uniref:Uncharacterized protein n=1 Tax=Rubripirellula lacrimiformis TaxID=1930273 RepID=A0A517NCS0_9BACT|nr:hypothetical protein K227x_33350 [Rubripirellula lacrimiformis]
MPTRLNDRAAHPPFVTPRAHRASRFIVQTHGAMPTRLNDRVAHPPFVSPRAHRAARFVVQTHGAMPTRLNDRVRVSTVRFTACPSGRAFHRTDARGDAHAVKRLGRVLIIRLTACPSGRALRRANARGDAHAVKQPRPRVDDSFNRVPIGPRVSSCKRTGRCPRG